jgi:RHS repeat-associated protein
VPLDRHSVPFIQRSEVTTLKTENVVAIPGKFTGQQQDTLPGLNDFLSREYSPGQGRWLSPDPVGVVAIDPTDPQTLNRYAYVGNSPCARIDPLGLTPCNLSIGGNINLPTVAQNEIQRIFGAIGVTVSFVAGTLDVNAIILQNANLGPGVTGQHIPGTNAVLLDNARIMGGAVYPAYYATYAPTDKYYYGYPTGLGRTIGHEIGHIFLGDSHAPTGIMRAGESTVNSGDPTLQGADKYNPLAAGQFNFTPSQAAAIRSELGCNSSASDGGGGGGAGVYGGYGTGWDGGFGTASFPTPQGFVDWSEVDTIEYK